MRPYLAPHPPAPGRREAPPAFSVAIAAYNAADSIAETVESVLTQTLAPAEVIVCDDGSTDGTAEALVPFAGRVEVLRQDNRGEGGAKNTATRAASGEFVAILDADDVYLPERLEALAELAMARPDLDILTTNATLVARERPVRLAYDATWSFEVADQRRAILERNFIFGHVAVRRDALLAAGGFDEAIRWTTDWDCWLRMIYRGSRAGLIDLPLAEYRLHPDALSSDRARMLAGRISTLEKADAHAGELGLSAPERTTLAASLAGYRRQAAVAGAREAARRGAPDARRLSLAIARDRTQISRTRIKAAATAIAPRLAGRLLGRRQNEGFTGAAGVRVDEPGRHG